MKEITIRVVQPGRKNHFQHQRPIKTNQTIHSRIDSIHNNS